MQAEARTSQATLPTGARPAAPEPVGDGVWRVTAGAFPSNAYICATDAPGEGFVVDPGLDPRAIDQAARNLGLEIRQVVCTHGHFDHIGGAYHFQQANGAAVFMHPADLKTMKSGNFLLMAMKLPNRITLPEVTAIDPNAPVDIGPATLVFRHMPGHTPGSCFIRHGDHLFTGDSLYARGVGLSALPGEDHDQLRRSLLDVWDEIPGGLMVHPGHGRSARFEEVRTGNAALLAFLATPSGKEG